MKSKLNLLISLLIVVSLLLVSCATAEPEPAAEATEPAAEQPTEVPAAEEGAKTIAFSGFSMTNEFWLTLERAAEARAEELGVEFINLTTEV